MHTLTQRVLDIAQSPAGCVAARRRWYVRKVQDAEGTDQPSRKTKDVEFGTIEFGTIELMGRSDLTRAIPRRMRPEESHVVILTSSAEASRAACPDVSRRAGTRVTGSRER